MNKGTISSIDRSKGYGFIESDDGIRVFFHQRWLKKIKFKDLNEGDEVVFLINHGPRGIRVNAISPSPRERPAVSRASTFVRPED